MRQSIPRHPAARPLYVLAFLALAATLSCGGDEEATVFSVNVTCSPSELFSDGSDSASCSVQVVDQNSQPAPSGTSVRFVSTLLGTGTPSGGFGSGVTPTSERLLGTTGSAEVEFRCTGVGSIAVIAAEPDGARGADQVDCIELSGDWVVEDVYAESPGLRPGESTEVCAQAYTGEGVFVTAGTEVEFTHDADNGGFGTSMAASRTGITGGTGEACVTYVAAEGDYRELVTITARFRNINLGETSATMLLLVDTDLPENEIRCELGKQLLLGDGGDETTLTCDAYGAGSAPATNTEIVCEPSADLNVSIPNNGVMVTDSTGRASTVVAAGHSDGSGTVDCEAEDLSAEAMTSLDLEVITVQSVDYVDGSAADLLAVLGSGDDGDDETQVCFVVIDNDGRPFPAGIEVSFDADGSTSAGASVEPELDLTNAEGEACTTLIAGTTASPAKVNARVNVGEEQVGEHSIPVTGADPSRRFLDLSCTPTMIGALATQYFRSDGIRTPSQGGLCATCTVSLADAIGNPIGFERTVSFRAEVGGFVPGGNQVTNDMNGVAEIQWCASGGRLPVDVDPLEGEPSWIDEESTRNPRDGLITIVAFVGGDEDFFLDVNGNGIYEPLEGDVIYDQPEPFVDVDDDNRFTEGRDIRIDVEGGTPGVHDPANDIWDQDTIIWSQTRILLTGEPYFDTSDELTGTDSSWPDTDGLEFDEDYPDPPRLSHWWAEERGGAGDALGNFYLPEGSEICETGLELHCLAPPAAWFNNQISLNLWYVMRDRNGNPMNNSLTGVTHVLFPEECADAVGVQTDDYQTALTGDPIGLPFEVDFVPAGTVMDYEIRFQFNPQEFSFDDYLSGSAQGFRLTSTGPLPDGGCEIQMITNMRACSTCGDTLWNNGEPFIVITDEQL